MNLLESGSLAKLPAFCIVQAMRFRTCLLGIFLLLAAKAALRADDWPQWLGPERDAVWREHGILEKFPAEGPKIRWRKQIGAGFAGPAVASGRVYLADRRVSKAAKPPKDPFDRGLIQGTE